MKTQHAAFMFDGATKSQLRGGSTSNPPPPRKPAVSHQETGGASIRGPDPLRARCLLRCPVIRHRELCPGLAVVTEEKA